MSSANNHKRNSLEGEFQRRLHHAEARPAPDLWARIDHDLTVQENTDYKKRALFYRQLAAACFVLFALTGSLLAYYYQGSQLRQVKKSGIATTAQPEQTANTQLIPEVAMQAYADAQKAEEEKHFAAAAAMPRQREAAQPSSPSAVALALADEPQTGDYYRISPAYSRYLGYSPMAGGYGNRYSGNRLAGAIPAQNGPRSFFAPNAGYTQIITWERITVTMGSNSPIAEQFNTLGNQQQALAAQPQSFVEKNEAVQALRPIQGLATTQLAKGSEKRSTALTTTKTTGRWSLNLAYAPAVFEQNIGLPDPLTTASADQSFRMSTEPGINASQESYQNIAAASEEFKESTQPAYSFALEAKAGFKLKEKLKLLTGIGYSENRSRSKSNYLVRQFWVKPRSNEHHELRPSTFFMASLSNGFISDSISVARTSDAFETEHKYRYLTVPVGLQYEHSLNKDWFVYAGAGVAANILLESGVKATNQDVQPVTYAASDSDSPFRQVQLSGNASVGVGKRLSNSLTLAMGPEVRHYMSTLVADPEKAAAPQGKPYAVGMNMSLNYQLGNSRK